MANEFSKTKDILVDYKVYIAGEYAPAMNVIAKSGIFSFSEATITLYANKHIMDLGEGDRVPVQIFYLDVFDSEGAEYKLMFEGEIVNINYTRTPSNVGIQISAVSHFEILAQLFKKLFQSLDQQVTDSLSRNSNLIVDNSLNLEALLGNELITNVSDIDLAGKSLETLLSKSSMLRRFPKANGKNGYIRRPFVLLRNILFDIVNGSTIRDKTKSDVQLFLRSFISKRNIYRTIFASPILEDSSFSTGTSATATANTILSAVNSQLTINMVLTGLSKLQSQLAGANAFSYWQLITQVYSVIMYEVLQPVCPPFLKADVYGVPQDLDEPTYSGMMHILTKPVINFGIPPICNTIFPCMINTISYSNDHFTAPTRCFLGNPSSIVNQLGSSSGVRQNAIQQIVLNNSSTVSPGDLRGTLKNNARLLNKKLLWDTSKSNYKFNAEFFKGPITLNSHDAPAWIQYAKRYISQEMPKESKDKGTNKTRNEFAQSSNQLDSVINIYSDNIFELEQASRKTINIELKFNPYIMAGFPMVIIDNIEYRSYYLAMPVAVTHSLSTNGAFTSVALSNVISFPEAYVYEKKGDYDLGPIHISAQVADIFNSYSGANSYYSQLLYQGLTRADGQYCFNPKNYFDFNEKTGFINTNTVYNSKISKPGVLVGREDLMDDFEKAMTHVYRPITSLTDFMNTRRDIIFMNSEGEYDDTIKYTKDSISTAGIIALSDRRFFNESQATAQVTSRKVETKITEDVKLPRNVPIFYERIMGFSALTDNDNPDGVVEYNAEFVGDKPQDVGDMPDFITNWSRRIELYRVDVKDNQDFYIG